MKVKVAQSCLFATPWTTPCIRYQIVKTWYQKNFNIFITCWYFSYIRLSKIHKNLTSFFVLSLVYILENFTITYVTVQFHRAVLLAAIPLMYIQGSESRQHCLLATIWRQQHHDARLVLAFILKIHKIEIFYIKVWWPHLYIVPYLPRFICIHMQTLRINCIWFWFFAMVHVNSWDCDLK